MSDKTPEFRFEGHEGEKFAFVQTQENFFYNSELLFIEYDDIIKSTDILQWNDIERSVS